jgi:hypothetical protein
LHKKEEVLLGEIKKGDYMSSLIFDTLTKFTKELGFNDLQWVARSTQYVTQTFSSAGEATRVAHILANALNLKVGNDDEVGTVTSSQGGTRVIIWNIPRFTQALETYQKKLDPVIEQMKTSLSKETENVLKKEELSILGFYEELINFTGARFNKIEWVKRNTQYVTQPLSEKKAKKIAETIAKDLNLVLNEDIDIADSQTGGTRVVIFNIPRFTQALQTYREKYKKSLSEMPKEIGEAQELLSNFCEGVWSGEQCTIGQDLENKFGVGPYYFIHIEPQEKEESYLLQIRSKYIPETPGEDNWTQQKLISYDDIKFILSVLKK